MTNRCVVVLMGARVEVHPQDYEAVCRVAPILLGLTDSAIPEGRAAKWAVTRAASLVIHLRAEAEAIR